MNADGRTPVRRRVAALVSLASLVVALVTLVVATARGEALRIAAAVWLLATVIAGLWFFVSRRGAARVAGAVLAGVALAALIAVVLGGEYRGVPLVISIALVVLAAATARFALSLDVRTLRATPLPGVDVPRVRRGVLIVNPRSGGGKAEKLGLVDACRARGVTPVVLPPGGDVVALAEEAIDGGADAIGVAGGDGSQALVAGVASRRDVAFVCVPAGTRNHFALDLGLDRDDVIGALDAFDEAVERRVDLARVNDRVFVNNATVGLYAEIVQSPDYRDAKVKTALDALPDLVGPDAEPLDLRYTGPDGKEHATAQLILVSNNPYELDRLAGRGTRPRLDAGVLGIASLRIADAKEAVSFTSLEATGRAQRFAGLSTWTDRRFTIDSRAPVAIGIDGESLLLPPPLVFESVPGALRVRLPVHAPGLAPAAAAAHLSTRTVRDLLAAARGRRRSDASATDDSPSD